MFQPESRGMPVDRRIASPRLADRLRALPRRYLWLALSFLLLPAALLAVEINPRPRTFLIAAIFIVAMVFASVSMLRKPEPVPEPDPDDPEACLQAQIIATRQELRKVDRWMRQWPLGLALAVLLKFGTLTNLEVASFLPLLLEMARSGSRTVLAFLILIGVLVHFIRRSLLLKRELIRLERLRAATFGPSEAPLRPA